MGVGLDDARRWLGRFISVMDTGDLDLWALWAAHTYLAHETYSTPRLQIDSMTSATRRRASPCRPARMWTMVSTERMKSRAKLARKSEPCEMGKPFSRTRSGRRLPLWLGRWMEKLAGSRHPGTDATREILGASEERTFQRPLVHPSR